jgi:hypothetical protein
MGIFKKKKDEKRRKYDEISLDDLPITSNHFEMLGMAGSTEKESIKAMNYSLNNSKKIDTVIIPRTEDFEPIDEPKKIEYLVCDKYGNGVLTIILVDRREPLTCVPSYVGKSNYPFLLENISPGGAYEVELVGKIPNDVDDEGYSICLSVPNLIRNNFWKVNQFEQLNINCSAIFQVADVAEYKPRMVERKNPNGSIEKMDMGGVGLLFPRQPSNPFYPYYYARGEIIDFREFKNELTKIPLIWMYVDTKITKLEIIGNANYLHGDVQKGKRIGAYVWLQGQIIELL